MPAIFRADKVGGFICCGGVAAFRESISCFCVGGGEAQTREGDLSVWHLQSDLLGCVGLRASRQRLWWTWWHKK